MPIDAVIVGCTGLARLAGEQLTIVHGNARDGADRLADRIGRRRGAEVIPVNADWHHFKGGAGHVRNMRMLAEHPDITATFAFRATGKSNGTDDMVALSKAAELPTYVITGGVHPEGVVMDVRPQ